MTRRLSLLAAACVALTLGGAAAAQAVTFPTVSINVKTDGGGMKGRFDIVHFSTRAGAIIAVGTLTGTLKDDRYPGPVAISKHGAELPVRPAVVAGTSDCARLDLSFGQKSFNLSGLRGMSVVRNLRLRPGGHQAGVEREVLCAASGVLGAIVEPAPGQPAAPAPPSLVHLLNAMRLLNG